MPTTPRIIQSYWSRPGLESNYFAPDGSKVNYGWRDRKYHYFSWAYSCLQFTRLHGAVDLYTDTPGKDLLIDLLRLPYRQVSLCLDDLQDYHPDLWVVGKVKAYSQPKEPFMHADGDVFLTRPLADRITSAGLVAQHIEQQIDYYQDAWSAFAERLQYTPESLTACLQEEGEIKAFNNGLIGGQDLDFFREYTTEFMHSLEVNIPHIDPKDYDRFNVLFEQALYYSRAHVGGQKVELVFEYDPLPPPEQIPQVREVLRKHHYLHPIYLYKKHPYICDMLECWLRKDYPEWYYRILHLLESGKI